MSLNKLNRTKYINCSITLKMEYITIPKHQYPNKDMDKSVKINKKVVVMINYSYKFRIIIVFKYISANIYNYILFLIILGFYE